MGQDKADVIDIGGPLPDVVDVRDGKKYPGAQFMVVMIDGQDVPDDEFWCFVDVPNRRGAKYVDKKFPGPKQIHTHQEVVEVEDIDIAIRWMTDEEMNIDG